MSKFFIIIKYINKINIKYLILILHRVKTLFLKGAKMLNIYTYKSNLNFSRY